MKVTELRVEVVLAIAAIIFIGLLIYGMMGISTSRAESQYTGHVVDVVEDKGIIFRPSWINMKTDPRSSDIQQFCIHPDDEDELLDDMYSAMESGDRYTITYSRPLWVSPHDCAGGQAIVHSIRPANSTSA